MTAPEDARPERRRGGRGRAAGLLVLLAALTGLTALPTWFTTTASTALDPSVVVHASGADVAPAVPAAALVLLACGAAIALVGRIGRWVVVAVVAAMGLLVVAAALQALADPWGSGLHQLVVGATSVGSDESDVTTSAWPYVAVVVGVVVLLAAVWLGSASRRWAAPSRRHEGTTGPKPEVQDERSAWDALSRGDDPS
ncbi:Trp biosynthesis-associated membrane protein [Cellulomonas edaphi]|uniref:Trp biosynthesis-associated membrane protein n=1 Tax=Cellulomonas edaphi TaxID=3053468 RepID=A0ABT7S5Z0_9CELL|nr:Trp biosynthesis-associated membrane protein [Cellulomons edaphi]MDM7831033.1 Trp biosynthesis-associated membrane protein [Cellulomons edaphi]